MTKVIVMNRPIAELAAEYPQIIEIMREIGFTDVTRPGMLQTAGRYMTLEKGAKLKKISHEHIRDAFAEHGYILETNNGGEPNE